MQFVSVMKCCHSNSFEGQTGSLLKGVSWIAHVAFTTLHDKTLEIISTASTTIMIWKNQEYARTIGLSRASLAVSDS